MPAQAYSKHFLSTGAMLALVAGLSGAMPARLAAQDTGFTSTDAEEEGYWYSRYNLGNLVMRSGLGETAAVPREVLMKALAAVDADFDAAKFKAGDMAYGDGDHAKPRMNAAPLMAVYKSGDPHFITRFDPPDFATQRWDPAKMDKTLTGLASGYTILKEAEWARQFHVDDHFGTPASDFGADWRFVGMIMNMSAKMQTAAFFKNMQAYDLSDGGAAVMLMAVSDVANLLAVDQVAHSDVPNRYHDPETAAKFAAGADKLFAMVMADTPASIRTRAQSVQALVWYAAYTENAANRAKALGRVAELAHALEGADPASAADQAYMLRALIEAHRTLGIDNGTIRAMGTAFIEGFDFDTGGFEGQPGYTIDDVAAIVGALNALRTFETADVDADAVNEVFTSFWENVVNKGGLQISAPPIKIAKSPFEYEGEPATYFRYGDSQPIPPKAGGDFGIAPVFATSVAYADGAWQVSDGRFDTAGAMHASNEMIWFHYDEINGFPVVDLSDALR